LIYSHNKQIKKRINIEGVKTTGRL
jgi:hypothetical protein